MEKKMEQILKKILSILKKEWEIVTKKAENPPNLFFLPAGTSILAIGHTETGEIDIYQNNKFKERVHDKRKRKRTPQGVR